MNATTTTESIYNLIPKPSKEEEKKPIYRSKHDPKAPLTGSTFGLHGTVATVGRGVHELKKTCVITSTFGPVIPKKPDPSNFLRRGSRTMMKRKSSSGNRFQRPQLVEAKPPIPSSNDRPIMGLKTTKNFIVSNATQAIMQEPKELKQKEESFLEKDTYGKIPNYLHKVKQDIQREKELIEEYVKQQNHDHHLGGSAGIHEAGMEYEIMDEEERKNLIRSLKMKWDEVNAQYQKICHRVTIDSLGDIKRKEMQEAELQQLEDDIQRLSRPGPLCILKQQ